MDRILHLVLKTCELCPYAKWHFNVCGRGDGIHCTQFDELGENTLIVLDSQLYTNNGQYPPIPNWCPLPTTGEIND